MQIFRLETEQKDFYRRTLAIAVPIMIQNAVTNFVSMLDNIMIGRIGTDSMSGVAIINQLLFVFYLCVFGGMSGIGIFTAQFYGKKDEEGIRYTFRLHLILGVILSVIGIGILMAFRFPLINMFLHEDGGVANAANTMAFATDYLRIMYIGLVPFALTQSYASVLKSMGETEAPMRASLAAVAVNLVGNYILIYGKLGLPAMGVVGAAIATVLSRFVELALIMAHTHKNAARYPFIVGAFASMFVPAGLVRNCVMKGLPLILNEALWAGGETMLTRSYSLRGLSVIAALNISQTVANVFNVAFLAMGIATGIIMGQEIGTGQRENLQRDANRLMWFSVALCIFAGGMLLAISGIFPMIYNTSTEIRHMAAGLIRVSAVLMPVHAYANAAYFILRSGGRTWITFVFDSCFSWLIVIPFSLLLVHLTDLPVIPIVLAIRFLDIVKCILGRILIRTGIWIRDITQYEENVL